MPVTSRYSKAAEAHMKVNQGNTGPIRPERARDARTGPTASTDLNTRATPATSPRIDRVEISVEGRARATGTLAPVQAPAAQRLAEVRQRVLQGAYDTDAVIADVARRILDRGDV
jgi:hypothetical protein